MDVSFQIFRCGLQTVGQLKMATRTFIVLRSFGMILTLLATLTTTIKVENNTSKSLKDGHFFVLNFDRRITSSLAARSTSEKDLCYFVINLNASALGVSFLPK